jgi:hypothetical protein
MANEAVNLYGLSTTLRLQVEEAEKFQSDDPGFNQGKLVGIENGPIEPPKNIVETRAPGFRKQRSSV